MQNARRFHARRLSSEQRAELETALMGPEIGVGHARRAQVILLSDDGVSASEIARSLGLSVGQISRIRGRFARGGARGLRDRPRRGRKDHAVPPEKIELIALLATSVPPAGFARWSTRLLGARVGLSSATVAKVLRARKEPRILPPPKERPSQEGNSSPESL